jgi:hypothetical protein
MTLCSYIALDEDLHRGVLSLLDPPGKQDQIDPNLPYPPPSKVASTLLESPGSCAITAMVDVKSKKLYVVNLGDCRAVAGWYNPETDMWRCDVLSTDHAVSNPDEANRSALRPVFGTNSDDTR